MKSINGSSRLLEVSGDNGAGEGGGVWPKFTARVDGGVDSGVDSVADDGSKFAASGVDELAVDFGAVVGSVMAEVGGDCATSEVYVFAEIAIAEVGKVTGGSSIGEDGVFDFDGLTDMAVVADGCGATKVTIWADLAVFADDDGAFNVNSGKDFSAFTNDDFGVVAELNGGMAGPVLDGGDELGVEIEEVPRVGDVEGSAED
jgi:hypothetical protein